MSDLPNSILTTPGALVYVVVGLIVFAEAAFVVGFVFPGETAALLAGVEASRNHVDLRLVIVVVVVAAVLGDSLGYLLGRAVGPRVLDSVLLRRHKRRAERAHAYLTRHGGRAVLFSRIFAFLRTVTPTIAGVLTMPYRSFLLFNAAGALFWGCVWVLLGFAAGGSYRAVEAYAGRGPALVLAAVGILVMAAREILHQRRQQV